MAACLANLGMPTHHTTPPAPAAAGGPAKWTVGSWRAKTALQQPEYPDAAAAEAVLRTVESFPPLVLPGEARVLEERLAAAAAGRAFVLQGGDCAESFRELGGGASARDTFRVLRQMAAVLVAGAQTPVVTVGRVAGQFGKPRSDVFEERGDGVRLLKYRGDIVNGHDFDEKSRAPDPQRMLRAYAQSAATLNLLRALAAAAGGREQGCRSKYPELARHVDGEFMAAAAAAAHLPQQQHYEFWTSHECLLLPYEQALTRREERGDDDDDGDSYYGSSAHMLWVGERTRQLDGAHVEFLRGLSNPLGIKVSDQLDPVELVKLIEILNPSNRPGRITVITRMGADNLRAKLPLLIRAVRSAGQTVTWVTDPMHGNTTVAPCGRRTRHFSAILAEVQAFFDVHEQEGSNPGGIHLEMTGQHVTECVGGSCNVSYDDLSKRYYTHCDPRLNASQSLELSFIVGQRQLRDRMHGQKAQHF